MSALLSAATGGLLLAASLAFPSWGDDLRVVSLAKDGFMTVTNTFPEGIVTLEGATAVTGPWAPVEQVFSLGSRVQMHLATDQPAAFFRPRALTLADDWTFTAADMTNLPALTIRLWNSDTISEFVWSWLSPNTQDGVASYVEGPDPALQQALADDFNALLQSGPIYDPTLFAQVVLSSATQELLAQDPQGPRLMHLNRWLLEDAYPAELVKKTASGFNNFTQGFGLLTTVAGAGGTTISPSNKWDPASEGGPATNAWLSRPHIAMADRAGNIYIADKEAHGIRKVTPDGTIHTVAGTNQPGFGTTNPAPATTVALNNPNGIWVRPEGSFYILDRDNGLIRKVDTNGLCTLVVNNGGAIPEGRGLWVSPDETLLYYCAGTQVKRWDTTNGLTVLAHNFLQLGNLAMDPQGRLAVTDRKGNRVYRLESDGSRTVIAGDGSAFNGGDGHLATATGLWEVRGIWFLPTGAYFLATDSGNQVWYVDTQGFIHLFLNGNNVSHTGDGAWFYDPSTPKVSKVRQITMDYENNLIITENDAGYIRKVQFLPSSP